MNQLIGQKRKHDVVWHRSGKIELSAYVVKELGIARGDSIGVMGDKGEYYLYVSSKGDRGIRCKATCYPSHKGGRNMKTHCKELTNAIYRIVGGEKEEKIKMAVGDIRELAGRKCLVLLYMLRI